jgi:hypothetical protein
MEMGSPPVPGMIWVGYSVGIRSDRLETLFYMLC